jgi:hypothetical protein
MQISARGAWRTNAERNSDGPQILLFLLFSFRTKKKIIKNAFPEYMSYLKLHCLADTR